MANARRRLRNLLVKEISLVDDGDNPGARFVLFKRRGQPGAPKRGEPGYDPKRFGGRRRFTRQPTAGGVHVDSTERDGERRRRRRGRRGLRALAKLNVDTEVQESGGRNPHPHELRLPDGAIAQGTYRTEIREGHRHDTVLPSDLQPGDTVTVETGNAIPDPPPGVENHTHTVRITATERVTRRRSMAKQVTKREAGADFPAGAFAFVPDGERPSTWKLRLFDKVADVEANQPSIVQTGQAVAALGPSGFRGNPVDLPPGERSAVIRRVRAAWLRAREDDDVSRDDLPDVLKSSWLSKVKDAFYDWAGLDSPHEDLEETLDQIADDLEQAGDAELEKQNRLGEFLRDRAEDRDLSVADLATAAGVSESTMQQILGGAIERPPDARLRGLASRLGVSFDRLIALVPGDRREPEEQVQGRPVRRRRSGGDKMATEIKFEFDKASLEPEVRKALDDLQTIASEAETKLETAQAEIVELKGDDDSEDDPLEGVPDEIRKVVEPQLKAADERTAAVEKENATLKSRLDKIEADTARTTFEKSIGDLTGLPQKRVELVETLWSIPDEDKRTATQKALEGAAAAARRGDVLGELGSSYTDGGSAYSQIESAAEEIRKVKPELSEAQARAQAMNDNPALYDAYLEESGGVN